MSFEEQFVVWIGLIGFVLVGDLVLLLLRFFLSKRKGNKLDIRLKHILHKEIETDSKASSKPLAFKTSSKRKKSSELKDSTVEHVKRFSFHVSRTAQLLGLIFFNLILIGIGSYKLYTLVSPLPEVVSSYPAPGGQWETYDQPLEFTFNVPVDTNKLQLNFSPETEGSWEFDHYVSFSPLARHIVYQPTRSFAPDERIMVYLAYMANPIHPGAGQEYLLEFSAPALPAVASVTPAADSGDVTTDTAVVFDLAGEDGKQIAWSVTIDPETTYEIGRDDPAKITLHFPDSLQQNTQYKITLNQMPVIYDLATGDVLEQGDAKEALSLSFTTVKAPLVSSFIPQGSGVFSDTQIVIEFDDAMDWGSVESLLQINPALDITFDWADNSKKLTINHPGLAKETKYEVILPVGIKNDKGGESEQEAMFDFETIGAVRVVGASPGAGGSGVGVNSSISVTFDQAVDHASAEQSFSISPHVSGSFSWSDNRMTFSPSVDLAYQTQYTYSLAAGIKSILGLDARESFSASFTTAPERYELNVPLYYQGRSGDEAWSCNIVAARMLLAYRGVEVSTSQLRNEIGYQQTFYSNPYRGGNPHKGFVPNYGTYWEAVSAGVNKYRTTRFLPSGDLTALLREVQNGNPVMIWGQNGWTTPRDISWTAEDGTYIYAVSGMHSIVVKGFVGTPENPSSIIVNDPWRGARTLSVSQFRGNWSYFNVAMVVN